jgi:superfamily II DNA or RNA helicase
MTANWLAEVTDTALRRALGDASVERGWAYVQDDRVIDVTAARGRSVVGTVRGTGGHTYSTVVAIQHATPGASVQVSGRCTCPVAVNCKHVAAVLLHARDSEAGAAARHLVAVPDPGDWERILEAALPPAEPPARAAEVPLALQFEMTLGHGHHYATNGLVLRPVMRGRSGRWVRTGVSWRELDRPAYGWPGPNPVHRAALLRIARETRWDPRNFGAPDRPVHADELGPRLWQLLDELVTAGVELVDVSGRPVLVVGRPAEATIDVSTASGPAVLTPSVAVEGRPLPLHQITFLGDPAHGLFLPAEPEGLLLAPLSRPVPLPLARMLQSPPVTVPESEISRFRRAQYRRLAAHLTVGSADGTMDPPTLEPPELELQVVFGHGHTADLNWCYAYRFDGRTLRSALDDPADPHAVRDPQAERALLQNLALPPALAELLTDHDGLVAHQNLTGLRTATLAEGLPALEACGVRVSTVGEAADYRFLEGDLVVTSSITDSDRRDWFDLRVEVTIDGRHVPFALLFTALVKGEDQVMLDDGSYFDIDRAELHQLRALIDEAQALQDKSSRGGLRVSAHQAGLWRELTDLGPTYVQSQRWSAAVDGLLALESVPAPPTPTSLTAELRPYQRDGFRWLDFLWTHGLGGVLADDMGLGKTVQTLAAICRAKDQGRLHHPALVVAPTSVVGNWVAEVMRFAPSLRVVVIDRSSAKSAVPLAERVAGADIVVTSYTLFRIDAAGYRALTWSALILDEAQSVKNHQSRGHRCARDLDAAVKFVITGTPLENNLMEFWALLTLAAPGLFSNADTFTQQYRRPIERGDGELLDRMRRRVRPVMLRRTKEQVAPELPPKQEQVLAVDLSPRHRKIYQTHLQRERAKVLKLLDEDADQHRIAILKSLTLLRRLALDPSLIDDDYADVDSTKLDLLVEQLLELAAEGHRALVFSQFTSYLALVRRRLEAAGIEYSYLDGSSRNRAALVADFKSGAAPVFLISLKAGGFGLNLTEADYCFVLDPWWNPAAEAQAVDRTHRIGQTRTVMVYRLVATGTIEEKVVELQERKRELFARVIDGGDVFGAALTADDIRGLLD